MLPSSFFGSIQNLILYLKIRYLLIQVACKIFQQSFHEINSMGWIRLWAYHPVKALNSFVLLAGRENGLMLT